MIGPDDGLHDMLRKPLGRVGDDRPRITAALHARADLSAEATRATLASSGWLASSVAGSEPPARAWAVVTGASYVGSGR